MPDDLLALLFDLMRLPGIPGRETAVADRLQAAWAPLADEGPRTPARHPAWEGKETSPIRAADCAHGRHRDGRGRGRGRFPSGRIGRHVLHRDPPWTTGAD